MKDNMMSKEIRKGFLKMIVLKIISERPIHGYDIINEIESKTMGHWVPSPGSIYPALDFLEYKRIHNDGGDRQEKSIHDHRRRKRSAKVHRPKAQGTRQRDKRDF